MSAAEIILFMTIFMGVVILVSIIAEDNDGGPFA
jgi:hypothetical protein